MASWFNKKNLFAGGYDGSIVVYDVDSGEELYKKKAHRGKITEIMVMPPDKLITTGDDKSLKIWNLYNLKLRRSLPGFGGLILSLCFVEGKRFATTDQDSELQIWSLDTYQRVRVFKLQKKKFGTSLLCYSREKIILCGRNDGLIEVWNYSSSKRKQVLKGHNKFVRCLIRIDRHKFASASKDSTIRIWKRDGLNYPCLSVLKGHEAGVGSVVKFGRGHLLSGSTDGTIRWWELKSGKVIHTFEKTVEKKKYESFDSILHGMNKSEKFKEEEERKKKAAYTAKVLKQATDEGPEPEQPEEGAGFTIGSGGGGGGGGKGMQAQLEDQGGVEVGALPPWVLANTNKIRVPDKYNFGLIECVERVRRSVYCLVPLSRISFAACCDDGKIRIYNAQTREITNTLKFTSPIRVITSLSNHLNQQILSRSRDTHGGGILLKRPKELGTIRMKGEGVKTIDIFASTHSRKKKILSDKKLADPKAPYNRLETLGILEKEELIGVQLPKERVLYVRYLQELQNLKKDKKAVKLQEKEDDSDDSDDSDVIDDEEEGEEGEEEGEIEKKERKRRSSSDDMEQLSFQVHVEFKNQTFVIPKSLIRNFVHLSPPEIEQNEIKESSRPVSVRPSRRPSRSVSAIRRKISAEETDDDVSIGDDEEDEFTRKLENDIIVYRFPDIESYLDDEILYEVLSGGDVLFEDTPRNSNRIKIEQYFELFQFFQKLKMTQHMYVLCRKIERIKKMKNLMVLFVKAIRCFEEFPFLMASHSINNEKDVVNSFMGTKKRRRSSSNNNNNDNNNNISTSEFLFDENSVSENEFGSVFTMTLFNIFRIRLSEIDKNPKYIRFFTTMGCFGKLEDYEIIPIEYHRELAILSHHKNMLKSSSQIFKDTYNSSLMIGFPKNSKNSQKFLSSIHIDENSSNNNDLGLLKINDSIKTPEKNEEEIIIKDKYDSSSIIISDNDNDNDDDDDEELSLIKKNKMIIEESENKSFYLMYPEIPSFRYLFKNNLFILFRTGEFTNTLISSKPVHKEILMIRSQFFYKIYRKSDESNNENNNNNYNNNNLDDLLLDSSCLGIDQFVLEGLLEWIYSFDISFLEKAVDLREKEIKETEEEEEKEKYSNWLRYLLTLFTVSIKHDEIELNFLVRQKMMDILVFYYKQGKIEVKFLEHGYLLEPLSLHKKKEFVQQLSKDFGIPKIVLLNLIQYSVNFRKILNKQSTKQQARIKELEEKIKELEK